MFSMKTERRPEQRQTDSCHSREVRDEAGGQLVPRLGVCSARCQFRKHSQRLVFRDNFGIGVILRHSGCGCGSSLSLGDSVPLDHCPFHYMLWHSAVNPQIVRHAGASEGAARMVAPIRSVARPIAVLRCSPSLCMADRGSSPCLMR